MTQNEKIQAVKNQILKNFDVTNRVIQTMARTAEEVFAYWFKTGLWSEKIADSVRRYKSCTEKQAFCMARDYVQNMSDDDVDELMSVVIIL